jgi:hypothetical protein
MECPICKGGGYLVEDVIDYDEIQMPCVACKETGKVNLWWMFLYWWYDTKLAAWLYKF